MDDAYRIQAEEWYERGRRDLETARLVLEQGGYTDAVAYHIQQSVEKYLKGYLVLIGKRPPKIHELDTLLNHVAEFDGSFEGFRDLCEKASRYYLDDRYPPGPPPEYNQDEVGADLGRATELINIIRSR
ncbi:MAG: HEPN domain-containing protein [Nitrospirae bacterium]|nr:HEPN domain-containing protein [Nitrospirota bacterium]